MTATEQLLTVAKAYARATGLSLTTVSTHALGDGKRLALIEGGASITVHRLEKTMTWFAQSWPDGTKWPARVPRPRRAA